jgi:hypothetical protein
MATNLKVMERGETRRAPTGQRASRQELKLAPGVELGILPTQASKALAAAGLAELGIQARYTVDTVSLDGAPFKATTVDFEQIATITTARAFIHGLLFSLYPPDALAGDVVIARNQWAHLQGKSGRCVAGLTFCCGEPSCITTASLRTADQARAAEQIRRLGWQDRAPWGWLCPEHADATEGGAA